MTVKKNPGKINVIIAALVLAVTVGGAVFMNWQSLTQEGVKEVYFSPSMSLKELAIKNGVPPGELRYKLSHEVGRGAEISMRKPVKALGIEEAIVRKALEHALEAANPVAIILKFTLWAVLISVVVMWVLQGKKIGGLRAGIMLFSVVIFGVALGVSPNPMEPVIKLFKWMRGMQGGIGVVAVSLFLFSVFSLWGAKLICSWGCQLGALQESIYNIPALKKYRVKVPFALSITVRLVLFGTFIVLLFNIGNEVKNFVLYHHVNYFKIYDFGDLAKIALYTLPIMLIASFFVFRPFCQFICPFGLWAWLLENLAINRIRIDRGKCIDCGKCEKSCPTEAMKFIHGNGRRFFRPDCWSCGKCIESCPTDAVEYGIVGRELSLCELQNQQES